MDLYDRTRNLNLACQIGITNGTFFFMERQAKFEFVHHNAYRSDLGTGYHYIQQS